MEMSEEKPFRVEVKNLKEFVYEAHFDLEGVKPIIIDEPPPLGRSLGPNAHRLVAAAVGNCLSASLLFCLRKMRVDVEGVDAVVEGKLARNERGRWRIREMRVRVKPRLREADRDISRCLDIFEDFCIVTQSIRRGIPIEVEVEL